MKLEKLISELKIIDIRNNQPECDIKKICYNSREVVPAACLSPFPAMLLTAINTTARYQPGRAVAVVHQDDLTDYQT